MIFLVVVAVLLAGAGVWFLARPLARGAHIESREEFFQLQTVRDRLLAQLNEVDLEERDRNMDVATAADERLRVEAELAGVLKNIEALAKSSTSASRKRTPSGRLWQGVVAALALAVPLLAVGLYFVNATVPPARLEQAAALPPPQPLMDGQGMPDPLQMVARLEKRLQENPDDPQGWLRLGRSYAVLNRPEDAKAAYEHAYRLLPRDYEPDSAEAYWFLGLAAYNAGDGRRAMDFWQRLLDALPPESDAAQQLQHVIEQARKKGKK